MALLADHVLPGLRTARRPTDGTRTAHCAVSAAHTNRKTRRVQQVNDCGARWDQDDGVGWPCECGASMGSGCCACIAIFPPCACTASGTILCARISDVVVSFAASGATRPAELGAIPPVTINPTPPFARSPKNAVAQLFKPLGSCNSSVLTDVRGGVPAILDMWWPSSRPVCIDPMTTRFRSVVNPKSRGSSILGNRTAIAQTPKSTWHEARLGGWCVSGGRSAGRRAPISESCPGPSRCSSPVQMDSFMEPMV